MSLLFIDGFDHYATADGLKKWNAFGTGVSIASSSGRRGGGALNLNGSTRFVDKTLAATYSTLIAGFAMDVLGGNGGAFLKLLDGSTVHVSLVLTATNAIAAYRGDVATLLGTSANAVVPASGYCYVEAKVLISDTVGTVDVKVNGVSVLSLSSQDTRNAGNASVTGFRLIGESAGSNFDDLYVCDTSGSTNNGFLGDCRIDTIYPNGAGNYTQFTPSTGSNYTCVDETAPNTTDYVDGSTVGDRDSYAMGNLSALASQTVYGVQVNAAILKDDAGSKSAATFVRSSSTNGDGAGTALGTSQVYISQVFETDPNGSIAWTESSVNAMEAGVKVTA